MNNFSYMLKDDRKNRESDEEEGERILAELEKPSNPWISPDDIVNFIWKSFLAIIIIVAIVCVIILTMYVVTKFSPFTFGHILR